MTKITKLNYSNIEEAVYNTLISQRFCKLPIDPLLFKRDGLFIDTYQNYASLTGGDIKQLALNGKLRDGFVVHIGKVSLILYDRDKYEPRQRFTLFHEIGHVVLKHEEHTSHNEKEANFFAAQFLLPNAIIQEIRRRGHKIDKSTLMSTFGVSEEAAQIRLDFLKEYPAGFPKDLDSVIVAMFKDDLDKKFPEQTDDYFDYEADEAKRNQWRSSW